MATGQDYRYFVVSIGGKRYEFGSRATPIETTLTGVQLHDTKSLAVGVTWDVWGFTSEEAVTAFDKLCIQSDTAGVQVEFTCDKGGEVGTRVFVETLVANLPLILDDDGSIANYTADFATGTADVIDRIRVRNPSGNSGTAIVTVGIFD